MPNDLWKCEWWETQDYDYDRNSPEIPRQAVCCGQRGRGVVRGALGLVEELAAVLALDRLILDFLNAIRAFFHGLGG